jgi:FKBP-type peptidyl-prolyl cis-trans isomerase
MRKNILFTCILGFTMLLISACGESAESSNNDNMENPGISTESTNTAANFVPYPIDTAAIVTLPSGLKYYMVQQGDGNQVKQGDKVLVHYHGMLTDGTVFDSSFERNQPSELSLDQVIEGWREGIPLCKVGARIVLIIPAELGYGSSATGNIPANSTLVFNVEVLGINS